MYNNPYPKEIVDEATGQKFLDKEHIAYREGHENGYDAGYNEGYRAGCRDSDEETRRTIEDIVVGGGY